MSLSDVMSEAEDSVAVGASLTQYDCALITLCYITSLIIVSSCCKDSINVIAINIVQG